jgi:[ribosomal protein S5]-alanine N-acetyltransferase
LETKDANKCIDMIETNRLILKPLTYSQLLKYLGNDHALEKELGLNESLRVIPDELKEALVNTILPAVADQGKNYLFSTLWTIILKKVNRKVGDLCFYGEPGSSGEIEVGYGTYPEFRKQGFMTEALCGMVKWAENQPNVHSILASTERNNRASFGVLQKNNFVKTAESEILIHWRLNINKT